MDDIFEAKKIIDSNLFRPPYGRITNWQVKALDGEKFQLKTVMWDVLSGDFDLSVSGEDCYLNVVNNAKKGSIVVFHDSLKALPSLQYSLPRLLAYYATNGFRFAVLP